MPAATATHYAHVELDHKGVPIISGTNMKVVELVRAWQSYAPTAEGLQQEHPYLTLGQIYSAMAYYADHKNELDADMERRDRMVENLRKEMGQPPLVERLKSQGLL